MQVPVQYAQNKPHRYIFQWTKPTVRCPIYNNSAEWGWTCTVRSIEDWNNLEKVLKNLKGKSFKMKLINSLWKWTNLACDFRFVDL